MKIGIVTITGESNYGNSLQNYAVEHTLQKLGCETVTLISESETCWSIVKSILYSILRDENHTYIKSFKEPLMKRKRRFWKFNRKYLNMKVEKNFENYDFVSCGSDQIWNFSYLKISKNAHFYFAQFVPCEKRMSFSASIGVNEIPEQHYDSARKGFENMRFISVREDKAKEIIEQMTKRSDVIVNVDPTFMLSSEEWRKISKKPKYIRGKNKKILLLYFLGNISAEIEAYISRVVKYYNFEVIKLYNEFVSEKDHKHEESFYTNPQEFLWLVEHSELLLTDSFHGCVFSIIFRKNFRYFSRSQSGISDMNSRINTLFRKLQLSESFLGTVEEEIENIICSDFSMVEHSVQKEQEALWNYLKNILNVSK